MRRRAFLTSPLALVALGAAANDYPLVTPGREPRFPRDHGAHPEYRTEWWYVTGWLRDGAGRDLGFQVTFFRNRPRVAEGNPSAFAPKQLLFAHAAIADPAAGRLVHDQRAARGGFGLAEAREPTTDVRIDDWSMVLGEGSYRVRIAAREFAFDLEFKPTQPILLQGDRGYSRKGPAAEHAPVTGSAWLDHEWSSEYLAKDASGWDWAGINLDDGGALMAFRIRAKAGGAFWAGGTLRAADGRVQTFGPGDIRFEPARTWRSQRTEVTYPVAMRLRAGELELALEPLLDDQELDSRSSTGTIYWEGAVRALRDGRPAGRGYLELTGYWKPLNL